MKIQRARGKTLPAWGIPHQKELRRLHRALVENHGEDGGRRRGVPQQGEETFGEPLEIEKVIIEKAIQSFTTVLKESTEG